MTNQLPSPNVDNLLKAFAVKVTADDVLRTFEAYKHDGFTILPKAKEMPKGAKVRYNPTIMWYMQAGKQPRWIVPKLDFTANTCFKMFPPKAEYKGSNPKFAVATNATYRDGGKEYQIGTALKIFAEVWERYVTAHKDTTYTNPFEAPKIHRALRSEKIIKDDDGNIKETIQYETEHVCIEIPCFPPKDDKGNTIMGADKEMITVFDVTKPTTNRVKQSNGKYSPIPYEQAQVEVEGKSVPVTRENVHTFIVCNSLVMGDISFTAVRSGQGYSYKIAINNPIVKPEPEQSDEDRRKKYESRVNENSNETSDADNANFDDEESEQPNTNSTSV